MKNIKQYILQIAIILFLIVGIGIASAQIGGGITLWYLDGTTLKPVDPTWNIDYGILTVSEGGTGLTTTTRGAILVGTSTSAYYAMATGTEGYVLKISSGIPAWGLTSYTETDPLWIASSTNFANWNTAYDDRLKWNGGSTGLVAATGRTSLELGNVENTAISTWGGSQNILTIGTIATGTWQGTDIDISDYTNFTAGTGFDLDADTLNADFNEFTLDTSLLGGDMIPFWEDTAGDEKKISWNNLQLSITALGTISTGTWQGTAIDISGFTNLAAGRSLTMSGDSVEADTELYSGSFSIPIKNATSTENGWIQHAFPVAITITKISCFVSTTTNSNFTFQLDERATSTVNSAGTDVMGTALTCASTTNSTTTFSNAGIAAEAKMNLDIDSVSATGIRGAIHIFYTKDD